MFPNVFSKVWNLETGSQCQFRVRAENRYGQSDACETEAAVIKDLYGLPGPPEKPKIAEHTRSSMLVTWDPPRDNGGSTISGYWLEKREKGSSYWARVNKAPVTKPAPKRWEFQVVRMIEGSAYEFRVMAVNIAGIGPPSGPSDPAYAVDPLSKYHSPFFYRLQEHDYSFSCFGNCLEEYVSMCPIDRHRDAM